MAKEKHNEGIVVSFDWDSPPNNRFTPWPIHHKTTTDCGDRTPSDRSVIIDRGTKNRKKANDQAV
jgi:hypothetical protein